MSSLTKILIAIAVLISSLLVFMVIKTSGPSDTMPSPSSNGDSDAYTLEGDWIGTLQTGAQSLRVVFHISRDEEGRLTGTWDIVDQGVNDLTITEINVDGKNVQLVMRNSQATFEGIFNESGTLITGTWSQLGNELPLELAPLEEPIASPERPQEPEPPFPYDAEDVTFTNTEAGIDLAGTLTLPKEGGPFPAAILISGSGPQNRDEELLGHKPFLVLADYLTRQGIAVLRYDDRGVGESGGTFAGSTIPDFATDAWAAVQFLMSRPEIDANNIGLVGHSEGGLTAPLVAVDHDEVAYVVLLAGPGIPGKEIILTQTRDIQRAEGVSADAVELTQRVYSEIFSIVTAEADDEAAEESIRELINALTEEERQKLGFTENLIDQQLNQWLSPWFRHFLTYDPAPTLERLSVPVLAIIGSNDLQVDAETNLAAIEAALERGGNSDFEVREYGSLNHLFQTSETGAPSQYSQIEETMSPQILQKIATWINNHVR